MNLDEIQVIFFQECDEGLTSLEAAFATIRAGAYDAETINGVFRCVHSIKGGAGAFGHERLQAYTHEYETLLDLVRNGTLALNPPLLATIMAAFDTLADHVTAARDGGDAPADGAMLDRLVKACEAQATAAVDIDHLPEEPAGGDVALALDDFDDLMAMLETETGPETQAMHDVAQPASDPGDAWQLTVRPAANAFDSGAEPLLLLRELALLGGTVISSDASTLPTLDAIDPERSYLGWELTLPSTVEKQDIYAVFEFTDGCALTLTRAAGCTDVPIVAAPPPARPAAPVAALKAAPAPLITPPPAPAPAPAIETAAAAASGRPVPTAGQTIRVELDRLDRLVNLVGELVITQAMLAQRLSESQLGDITELSDLDHLTRELQESTMAIRAQPMKTVFSRVPRIIRELESETGKRVRLEIEGEMTEVDKTVVERIGEPLTHLIRNAVDHGLETTDERIALGKSEEGVVRLSAAHHSGRIVITVSDDGRGIDRARVRAKAIERGIVPPDVVLSDEEVDNLIFAPGFSTAATLSNISGRGVGMDVVRRNIQALGGRIGIQSRLGEGSSFSLSLPLTLAVLDGMIVTVGDQSFVIPLNHVVESLRRSDAVVNGLGPQASLIDVRGSYIPVHRIADRLNIAGAKREANDAVLIVVDGDHGQAALMVDAIQDQRQVVVKSLEANYRAIDDLAGATILGDGRVALILDVDSLTARRPRTAALLDLAA